MHHRLWIFLTLSSLPPKTQIMLHANKQTMNKHVEGHGCPHCRKSRGEKSIKLYLDKHYHHVITQHWFPSLRGDTGKPLQYDFFVPQYNLLIEFDGAQHFKPYDRFGGKEKYDQLVRYDAMKNIYALIHGIRILRIPYTKLAHINSILDEELTKRFIVTNPKRLLI